jgi:hypothetical protein
MSGWFRARGDGSRAHRELEATGEAARKHSIATDPRMLTAQEAQIARMARDGHSNPEIGVRGCSSAPAPWRITCSKSSPSSTSGRADSSTESCLTGSETPQLAQPEDCGVALRTCGCQCTPAALMIVLTTNR